MGTEPNSESGWVLCHIDHAGLQRRSPNLGNYSLHGLVEKHNSMHQLDSKCLNYSSCGLVIIAVGKRETRPKPNLKTKSRTPLMPGNLFQHRKLQPPLLFCDCSTTIGPKLLNLVPFHLSRISSLNPSGSVSKRAKQNPRDM